MVEVLVCQRADHGYAYATPDRLGFLCVLAEHAEQGIYQYSHEHQIDDIECHGLYAGYGRGDELIGKICER